MFNICKTIETSIIECINNNSFPGLLVIRTFEKWDPGYPWQRRWQRRQCTLGNEVVIEALGWGLHEKSFLTQAYRITFLHWKVEFVTGNHRHHMHAGSIFLIGSGKIKGRRIILFSSHLNYNYCNALYWYTTAGSLNLRSHSPRYYSEGTR